MARTAVAQAELCRLRRDIARMEGRLAEEERLILDTHPVCGVAGDGAEAAGREGGGAENAGPLSLKPRPRRGCVPLGIPRLDAAIGGGLPLAALHEIRADESRDGGAAAGFALALAARIAAAGGAPALIWISEADLRREAGRLYAPGLAALGLDPARVVEVAARTEREALWAFEAALGCRGTGVAVCELRRASLDLTATRRAALRARDCGVTGLLLRLASAPEPSAAALRFGVAPAPAGTLGDFSAGVGRMAWRLTLEKNRGGPTGAFSVEWTSHERRFIEKLRVEERRGEKRGTGPGEGDAAADPQPLPAAPFHRPADPPPVDPASRRRRGRTRRYAS